MSVYEDFFNGLLPGNYALTKSMELTKIQSSGTLWYTKKFLVLYYYVFLSNDIFTNTYIQKVINSFDAFINSLDESIRENAVAFFYPSDDSINFKSEKFKSFASFTTHSGFNTQNEMNEHYQNAKKMYFTLLMGSGGQTGIKKKLKEACKKEFFIYSQENIERILFKAVLEVSVEQANHNNHISDNSIKYIISRNSIDEICQASLGRIITEDDVQNIILSHDTNEYRYRAIENDMVAFIRNERQILYYYGYFHSKSVGATDFEFSSLTPVGELAVNANFYEFLALWEHQKVKMISQPATTDINNLSISITNPENFSISFRPYTDILGHLVRNKSMSVNEYKYVISRRNHNISENVWIENEADILNKIEFIEDRIKSFKRRRDIADEDSRKELLKYMLGVRNDLDFDNITNPLGVISFERAQSKWTVNNIGKLEFLLGIYSNLEEYKEIKYGELFSRCENNLRERYVAEVNGNTMSIDPHIKIEWDLYNIRVDKFILFSIIATMATIMLGESEFNTSARDIISNILPVINEKFRTLTKMLGIKTNSSRKLEFEKAISALTTQEYSDYIMVEYEEEEEVLARYKEENTEDLRTKIITLSLELGASYDEGRNRNPVLISLLKSYYMTRFLYDGMLKCECCGDTTFITNAGEPYIEFHHLIPFNIAEGPDHYLNLFALCPNCHRKIHFLSVKNKHSEYENINHNNYLQMSFCERLQTLKNEMILKSYHLEYLLAETAITQDEYDAIVA